MLLYDVVYVNTRYIITSLYKSNNFVCDKFFDSNTVNTFFSTGDPTKWTTLHLLT